MTSSMPSIRSRRRYGSSRDLRAVGKPLNRRVDASEIFEIAIGQTTRQIARTVQPLPTVSVEKVRK